MRPVDEFVPYPYARPFVADDEKCRSSMIRAFDDIVAVLSMQLLHRLIKPYGT